MSRKRTHLNLIHRLLALLLVLAPGAGRAAAPPALPAFPTVEIVINSHVNCYGGSNGALTAVVTGTSNFSLQWSGAAPANGAITNSLVGLPAGVYTVTVTDNTTGYIFYDAAVINQPYELTATFATTHVACFGQSTGAISLAPAGGTPTYTYTWANQSGPLAFTTPSIFSVPAGDYMAIITDGFGCRDTVTMALTQPASAVASTIAGAPVACAFGSNGSVDLTVFGGTAPYTYNWNGGLAFSQDLTNVPANTYDVTITDANGCTALNSFAVTEPPLLGTTVSGQDVGCFGQATGNIDLTVTGGTLPYTFTWTNSTVTLAGSEDLFNVPADAYSVTVTDARGCTATNGITISQPPALTATGVVTHVECFGEQTGSVILTVLGGSPAYGFSWSNGAGTQDLTAVGAGTYTLTITDQNTCTLVQQYTITQPGQPLTATLVGTNVLCNSENTGAVNLTVSGGTTPYTFSWNSGPNTEDIAGLLAGFYQVTVLDANGCSNVQSITLTEPAAPLLATTAVTDVSCWGLSDGAIETSPTGGTLPYTFQWANAAVQLGTVAEDLLGYPAQTYFMVLSDANGCAFRDTFTITEPTELLGTLAPTQILCFGAATGAVDLAPTGGTLPYSFLWSNGAVTEDITDVPAGPFTVTVTDAQNCTLSLGTTLSQPDSGLSSTHSTVPVTCFGGADGSIAFEAFGGTEPYTYAWSNGGTTRNLFDLTAGVYGVLVTDFNGCTHTDTATVLQPEAIVITETVTRVSCFGLSDGAVDITAAGGIAPYRYHWTNSGFVLAASTQDIAGRVADTYIVTVTDTNGCTASKAFLVYEPQPLVSSIIKQDLACFGTANGTANLTVTGGTLPYAYLWSNGETTEDLQNISAGTYSVTVVDSSGCTLEDSVTLTQPDSIRITAVITDVSCVDQADGAITATASMGSGGYTYLWSTGSNLPTLTGLAAGTYTVTVTDVLGCLGSASFTVGRNDAACLNIPNAYTPNDDGTNDTWVLRNIELYPDASIRVFNQWGVVIFEANGADDPWDGTYRGTELPAATYYYIIVLNDQIPPYTGAVTLVR